MRLKPLLGLTPADAVLFVEVPNRAARAIVDSPDLLLRVVDLVTGQVVSCHPDWETIQ